MFNLKLGELKGIEVKGHRGTWYSIDSKNYVIDEDKGEQKLYIMEHETYGGEAAWVIIDEEYNLILENAWNGWFDLDYCIEEKIPFNEFY